VLDGWRDGPPDGLPLLSQTWMVLGAGDDPILGILSSADNAAMGRPWTYIPTDNELMFGVPSELFTGNAVTPADGAVSFRLRSDETARTTYSATVFGAHVSAVLEKPFPPQSLSFRAVDERVIAVDTDEAADVQCSVTVVKCANEHGCCPGGALRCACPPFDPAPHEFRAPRGSGLYLLEARLLSPRPGRIVHANVVIPEPEIRVEAVGGGRFCFHGTAVDHAPLPAEAFHAAVFDGERFVALPIAGPAGCADSDDVGSLSVCPAAQVRLDVTDADGNHGELVFPGQSGSDCAPL